MAFSESELDRLVKKLSKALSASGLSLATAESCTGGWIGKLITDVSGSSKHYVGGVVCYSNKAKRELLDVKIGDRGEAVTERVALEMADGALKKFGAKLAVATTGYMDKNKKLEAYVCVAMRHKRSSGIFVDRICEHFTFNKSDRPKNRIETSHHALRMLLEIIKTKET